MPDDLGPLSRVTVRAQRQLEQPYDPQFGAEESEEEEPEDEELLQTKRASLSPAARSAGAVAKLGRLGSGSPLPAPVRSFMEVRFGHDFSGVRIHTDRCADEAAASVNARAFTLGRNVVFAAGQWNPDRPAGRHLLAHELAHVVQQGASEDSVHSGTVRRVRWFPNRSLGRTSKPWGFGPSGKVLEGRTDAGTPLQIWRPDNGVTYWCHGYTFGGHTARGGPYSAWGADVMKIVADDGWSRVEACVAGASDITVFFDPAGQVAHSGIIRTRASTGGIVNEGKSTMESKWGQASLNTSSWTTNVKQYGKYRCYSKFPAAGPCAAAGANELP